MLSGVPVGLKQSDGMACSEWVRIVDNWAKLIGSWVKRRVEPRRRMTVSMGSVGNSDGTSGSRRMSGWVERTGLGRESGG